MAENSKSEFSIKEVNEAITALETKFTDDINSLQSKYGVVIADVDLVHAKTLGYMPKISYVRFNVMIRGF